MKLSTKLNFTALLFLTSLWLAASLARAAPPPGPGPVVCDGIETGLGCISTDPTGLVEDVLRIAIGVASGIAMLLLITGAFKVLTSSGDPKSVLEGKETITSAIAGLLLILLSVAILNIIGFNILGIPFFKP